LTNPIDIILQDHNGQLDICDKLEDLASRVGIEPLAEMASEVLSYLTRDLKVHIEDEESDLFPQLASRASANAELVEVLDQLVSEHEADMELAARVIEGLNTLADGSALANPTRFFMDVCAFCANQRRHLSWENRIVLPLAERLLSEDQKETISRSMAARRRQRSSR
jgi:hemerythrin-like domain-containing protein